jgi:hypothetical protein
MGDIAFVDSQLTSQCTDRHRLAQSQGDPMTSRMAHGLTLLGCLDANVLLSLGHGESVKENGSSVKNLAPLRHDPIP